MKLFVAIVTILFVALFTALIHFGLFSSVEVSEIESEPLILVYESHRGDFSKTPEVINKVFFTLYLRDSIKTTKGFGMYFDNPEFTPKDSLRWIAGSILEPADTVHIDSIRKDFSVAFLHPQPVAEATFEYKGQVSVLMGIYKVYPVIGSWARERNFMDKPIMEIYDQPGRSIHYRLLKELSEEQKIGLYHPTHEPEVP